MMDSNLANIMRHVAIFHQIACVLNQITKNSEFNQYRIARYLNRIVLGLNLMVDASQIAIRFCPSLVRTVAPRSSLGLCIIDVTF